MDRRSLALIAWIGILLTLPIQAAVYLMPSKVAAQQSTAELSEERIKRLAKSITVKIISGDNGGSGILIRKDNQVYTVITNRHVLEPGKTIKIQTEDGKIYQANLVKGVNFQGKDLALLQFRANANYAFAYLGNLATVSINERIYAAGFPFEENSSKSSGFVLKSGQVLLLSERAFKEGYQIGYSNEIEKGMSGGPILNRRGQVIGINGIHAYPLWGNPYVYEDGSQPTEALKDLVSRYSWGIPIQTFARLAPQYASKESLPVAYTASTSQLPPIANEVNNIAKEITVRIDVPTLRECSGSGVIVAKRGNTYSILTAEHVVRGSQKCDRTTLEIITPDGKQYPIQVNDSNLKTLAETDLAILQFTSDQNYRVATLADYPITGYEGFIFVAGWLGLTPGSQETQRQFTAGKVASKQLGSLIAKNSLSLSYGYGLLYSNITNQGMSGGPVLDTRGRVIGIHGKAEQEEITDKAGKKRLITLGFSWGVPINSFVRWAQSGGLSPILRVENTVPPKLTEQETNAIVQALFKVEKPKNNADAIDWLNYAWQVARNAPNEQQNEAIKAIERAIQLEPNFYQAWYTRGIAQLSNEDKQQALKSFEKATQIEPKFAPAWRLRGFLLLGLEKYSEALEALDQVAKLEPDDASVEIFRSIILFRAKRFPEALKVANQAVKNNRISLAYFARGVARFGTGDLQGALTDLNEAIRLNPESIESTAYQVRGTIRFQQQDYKEALADFNEAVRLAPKDTDVRKLRGISRFIEEDYKGALADFSEILRINPKDTDTASLRDVTTRLLQGKPGDIVVSKTRGALFLYLKDYKRALVAYNEALRLNSKDVEVLKNRAEIRLLQQDYKGAVADFNELVSLKPDDTDAHHKRGQALAKIGNYQAAIADYNQILSSQEFSGIGVQTEINAQTKLPTVIKVFENSPAQKAGVKTGDQILAVDDQPTANMSLEQVIKLIRGQTGTPITLQINRAGKNKLSITLKRAPIALDMKLAAEVYYNRGLARLQMKDTQGARQDWEKAADLYKQEGNTENYQLVLNKIKELQ